LITAAKNAGIHGEQRTNIPYALNVNQKKLIFSMIFLCQNKTVKISYNFRG
jgi:hypothetical protein